MLLGRGGGWRLILLLQLLKQKKKVVSSVLQCQIHRSKAVGANTLSRYPRIITKRAMSGHYDRALPPPSLQMMINPSSKSSFSQDQHSPAANSPPAPRSSSPSSTFSTSPRNLFEWLLPAFEVRFLFFVGVGLVLDFSWRGFHILWFGWWGWGWGWG